MLRPRATPRRLAGPPRKASATALASPPFRSTMSRSLLLFAKPPYLRRDARLRVAAAASPRLVSPRACPRRGRGVASPRLHGLVRGRAVAATRLHGLTHVGAAASPRLVSPRACPRPRLVLTEHALPPQAPALIHTPAAARRRVPLFQMRRGPREVLDHDARLVVQKRPQTLQAARVEALQ